MDELEKKLIKKCKAGDIDAFEQLIGGHQKRVYNIALRIMGNEEDAKDMAQEALLRAYRSIGGFKEQSAFSTWMYRIVTNVCLDEIRRRKNENVTVIENISETEGGEALNASSKEDTPEKQYERLEQRQIIEAAIKELNEEYRSVIVLRDIQGFSYEEISVILQCSSGTVKSRINRARNILKDKLKSRLELSYGNSV